jgi:hypothetical protein
MTRRLVTLGVTLLTVTGSLVAARALDRPEAGRPASSVATTVAPPSSGSPATVPPTTVPPLDTTCRLTSRLGLGDSGADVRCLETHLAAREELQGFVVDDTFDELTELAIEVFQRNNGLVVDGVVGPQTARVLGAWADRQAPPPDPAACAPTGRSAVVDRSFQRTWLCDGGTIARVMPITSAWSQPDPGSYEVYGKDLDAASSLSGELSTMTHFVAFTHGKFQGARIGFHSVPVDTAGEYVQALDTVGVVALQGDSSGCIRVLPDDAVAIWDWLQVGDDVIVVS